MNVHYPIFFALLLSIQFSFPVNAEEPSATEEETNSQTTNNQESNDPVVTDKADVEAQILRIRKLLETDPKPRGWVVIGDASMHLKKYGDAVEAYQTAFIMEDDIKTRRKLKRAIALDNGAALPE